MSAGPTRADASGMPPSGRVDRPRSCWRRDEAQTMAEYVVVLAVITPIVILAFASLSGAVLSAIENARSFL
jgi:Flp pilus assembly pilin Flp